MRSHLEGKTFGKWKVGKYISNSKGKKRNEHRGSLYECTCACGEIHNVFTSSLINGTSTQCLACRGKDKTYECTICINGHDTSECGRKKGGECRMCAKEKSLRYTYGLSLEDYKALYDIQKGKCAICGRKLAFMKVQDKPNIEGRSEIDHAHILKKQKIKPSKKSTVRGILCGGRWSGCNIKLGKIDNIEWLTNALLYLTNPPAQQLFGKEK